MRMRAIVVALAAAAVVPGSASAAITNVYVDNTGDGVCVRATTADPVTFQMKTPEGNLIETAILAAPNVTAGTTCGGAGMNRFRPEFQHYSIASGSTVVATQGVSVQSIRVPYAAYSSADGGTTGRIKVRNFPNPANITASPMGAHVGAPGFFDQDLPVAAPGGAIVIDGFTPEGAVYNASISATRWYLSASGSYLAYNSPDFNGAPITVTLRNADGSVAETGTMRPRPGGPPAESIGLDTQATPGMTATISQPGWFEDRAVRYPDAALRPDGFDVAIPAGSTGGYSLDATFVDPVALALLPAEHALRCTTLGPTVGCAGGGARYAVNYTGTPIGVGDEISVNFQEPDGDRANSSTSFAGASGNIRYSELYFLGKPRAGLSLMVTIPRPAPLAPRVITSYAGTDRGGYASIYDLIEANFVDGTFVTYQRLRGRRHARPLRHEAHVGADRREPDRHDVRERPRPRLPPAGLRPGVPDRGRQRGRAVVARRSTTCARTTTSRWMRSIRSRTS